MLRLTLKLFCGFCSRWSTFWWKWNVEVTIYYWIYASHYLSELGTPVFGANLCVCSKLMCLHLLCFLLCCFPSSFETGSSTSNSLFAWGCSWTQVYSLCLPSVSVTDDYRYASPYLYILYFLHGLFPLLKCRGCLYLFWIILGPSWFYHIKMPMPAGFELSLALVN